MLRLLAAVAFFFTTVLLGGVRPGPYVDFGVLGKTYPVVEDDISELLKKEMSKIVADKKKMKSFLEESVKKMATFSSDLPLCQKTVKNEWEKDFVTLSTDIYNPLGRKVASKGDKIPAPLPKGKKLSICFVGGNDFLAKKEIEVLSGKIPDCLFLVSGSNVLKLREKFPNLNIYPSGRIHENRWNIRCYPTVIRFREDEKKLIEIGVGLFRD